MKRYSYQLSCLFMMVFMLTQGSVFAQEKPMNPFKGYNLLVVSDGSAKVLKTLPVLGSIKEHQVLGVILPMQSPESALAENSRVLKSAGMANVPIERHWNVSLIPPGKKVICICLGNPSLMKEANIPVDRLARVITVSDSKNAGLWQEFLDAGITVDQLLTDEKIFYSDEDINQFVKTGTTTGKVYASLISVEDKPQMVYELAGIYLLFPELINMKPEFTNPRFLYSASYDPAMLKSILTDILAGAYRAGEGVAFAGFPLDPAFYKYDVRQIMDSAIARYGVDEWKACVLTDEIHGHLGIYSIIGAKMGMLARDYFSSGPDKLSVTSYAGSLPPKSCFNDGLQASTGATVGQGLITVEGGQQQLTQADFEYQGRKIKIELKEPYLKQIEEDISRGIAEYGLMNAGYWKMVRNLSLNYWRDWDRNTIFRITVIR